MTQPVHFSNKTSFTGNQCRTCWDNVRFPEAPDPVTDDLGEVTCADCRAWLVREGRCPECGEHRLTWLAGQGMFHLGCEHCSATLISQVDPSQVAEALTQMSWRPPA